MRLIDRLTARPAPDPERMSLDGLANLIQFMGNTYGASGFVSTTWAPERSEPIGGDFGSVAQRAFKANPIVFTCVDARMRLFTEARFKFRNFNDGRPGDLYGTNELAILEKPWRNGTTGDLLARMEVADSLAGNFFATTVGAGAEKRIVPLRPDWVAIVFNADPQDPAAQVIGYTYKPGGPASKSKPVFYTAEQVVHYAPTPDPEARFRGMAWLTPVLREVEADSAATRHKAKFFNNAATPNLAVSLSEKVTVDAFKKFVEIMEERGAEGGIEKAYKTLWLAGGADVTVIGADLGKLNYKTLTGAGETRISAAAGLPPIVGNFSEGLEAATYSNYSQARRAFGDHWARPRWRNAAASLAPLVRVPNGAELWYDDRDIAFLREDRKDAAEIAQLKAATIRQYVDAGFDPPSAVAAVENEDPRLLKHTGLYSVQLQAPGAVTPPAA